MAQMPTKPPRHPNFYVHKTSPDTDGQVLSAQTKPIHPAPIPKSEAQNRRTKDEAQKRGKYRLQLEFVNY